MSPRWRVTIRQPRPSRREKSLFLRARQYHRGKAQDQRISTKTTDPVKAEELRTIFEEDLNAGLVVEQVDKGTLSWLFHLRIDSLKRDPDTSPNTISNHRAARLAFEVTALGKKALESVTKLDVVDAESKLRERLGASTTQQYMGQAKSGEEDLPRHHPAAGHSSGGGCIGSQERAAQGLPRRKHLS